MTMQWILGWWNLIFLVPFALALAYLGVYTLSGWTFGDDIDTDVDHDVDVDADADVDADVDAHVDADADTDVSADADADSDVDSDADHDADHDTESEAGAPTSSTAMLVLSWLGLGKVPLSILLMVLAMCWGFIGFVTNNAAKDSAPRMLKSADPATVALVSLPLAGIGSLLITSTLSRIFAKVMPKNETYARRRHELLGNSGDAIYDIDSHFGMASVRDDRGNLFQVACRSEGKRDAIRKGSRVKLVGYNKN